MHFVLLVVVVSGFIVRAGTGRRSSSLIGVGFSCGSGDRDRGRDRVSDTISALALPFPQAGRRAGSNHGGSPDESGDPGSSGGAGNVSRGSGVRIIEDGKSWW